jgi:hypothetical protein
VSEFAGVAADTDYTGVDSDLQNVHGCYASKGWQTNEDAGDVCSARNGWGHWL